VIPGIARHWRELAVAEQAAQEPQTLTGTPVTDAFDEDQKSRRGRDQRRQRSMPEGDGAGDERPAFIVP